MASTDRLFFAAQRTAWEKKRGSDWCWIHRLAITSATTVHFLHFKSWGEDNENLNLYTYLKRCVIIGTESFLAPDGLPLLLCCG